ncbi:Regenerating islet-derived protein 3-gamma [Myotis davidii]|uniref:Regenerating islet-derived protein 3-gamma n=1 Tax=Myotis davidii TaxID=225400 RepID=L5MHT8_MYODS|nr:Regenerating islet-derived protein 3-gamma [Myotis davidii]
MLPPMALPRMSWMLLSCLMLLSQVQGELSLPAALGSLEGYAKIPIAIQPYLAPFSTLQGLETNAGGWEWSNSDVLDYTAWEKHPASISKPDYCGTLSGSSGYLSWKDYDCKKELPYICKFKG